MVLIFSKKYILFHNLQYIFDCSKYDEVQNNKNDFNKSSKIENNNYEHRLNNWLVSVEDTLSSFNLNEVQKNTLKKLFKKLVTIHNIILLLLYICKHVF